MHLLLLPALLLRVAADNRPPLSAYAGDSVTLLSGADPLWNLSAITWSIWPNTTWIAKYDDKRTNTNLFYKYRGRLQLNEVTGDLTITNVSSADEMKYTVDFFNTERKNKVNTIQLRIKQRLNQPLIRKAVAAAGDICLLALNCSSSDPGVSLSWESDPHLRTLGHDGDTLMAVLNKTHTGLNFTCVSRKNSDNSTSTISITCEVLSSHRASSSYLLS
uniref:Ig-like domain-containing protein n=1 Tax=Knipowitschia caucasica TaxID=637954 RepID=A0AAV2KPY5_KNICA